MIQFITIVLITIILLGIRIGSYRSIPILVVIDFILSIFLILAIVDYGFFNIIFQRVG